MNTSDTNYAKLHNAEVGEFVKVVNRHVAAESAEVCALSFATTMFQGRYYLLDYDYRADFEKINETIVRDGLNEASKYKECDTSGELSYAYYSYSYGETAPPVRIVAEGYALTLSPDLEKETQLAKPRFFPGFFDRLLPVVDQVAFSPSSVPAPLVRLLILWHKVLFPGEEAGVLIAFFKLRDDPPNLEKLVHSLQENCIPLLETKAKQLITPALRDLYLEESERSVKAAIMARNMSHNLGSHVLASLTDEECRKRSSDVKMLLSYLEQRMDFVAGVLAPWPEWRESVFFYSDLLQSFLNQGLLLDYIIRDDGYSAGDIQIRVEAENGAFGWKYESISDGVGFSRFTSLSDTKPADFSVSLPGGGIGKQAFYGFIENALRNGARHNPIIKSLEIRLGIECHDDQGYYTVTYRDNVSRVDKEKLEEIRLTLKTPLVDRQKGQPVEKDWGLQEMKVYAGFLGFLGLGLPSLFVHEEDDQRFPLWADWEGGMLTYRFRLRMPVELLILDPGSEARASRDCPGARAAGVRFTDLDDQMHLERQIRSLSPHILLVPLAQGDGMRHVEKVVGFLGQLGHRLPARVLLVTSSEEEQSTVRKALAGRHLTTRRVVVIQDPRFSYPGPDQVGAWQPFLIRLYRQWLEEVVGPGPWNLVLYLERSAQSRSLNAWGCLRKELPEELENCHIRLYHSESKHVRPVDERRDALPREHHGRWVVFDNHGKLGLDLASAQGGPLSGGCADFYQAVGHAGGVNNVAMFDLLNHVPVGSTGSFFLLRLLEASLARILLIDDRVAKHIAKADGRHCVMWKKSRHKDLLRTRIFFSLSFQYQGLENADTRKWLLKLGEPKGLPGSVEDPASPEGVYVRDSRVQRIVVVSDKSTPKETVIRCEDAPHFDVVVVHWGWLQEQRDHCHLDLLVFLRSLRDFADRVVLTSGRASTGGVPKDLPFVSFSTIESYVLRELSKYHLTNALLAACAERALP